MAKKIKKTIALLLIMTQVMLLAGCDVEIFEDKSSAGAIKPVNREDLLINTYYVKEGTKFYQTKKLDMSNSGVGVNKTKCAWVITGENLIPDYYKGEVLARAGKEIDLEAVALERYKDCGYSIGLHNIVYEDGLLLLNTSNNVIKNTSIAKALKNAKSSYVYIETINGQYVKEDMINEAGIILGMEEGGTYEITYYAGTYYGTMTVTADTHFFQSYEIYKLTDLNVTKNGYVSIVLPEDYKDGVYRIDGSGFFKYYGYERGVDTASIDMNVPYYHSEEDQIAAYSQQFVFNLTTNTADVSIKATYVPDTVSTDDGNVKMLLTAPDGTTILTEELADVGEIVTDMKEAMAGEWIVNIVPQSMTVKNVELVSNEANQEATKETFKLSFDEAKMGIIFTLQYEGDGIVNAQVVDSSNKSYDMVKANETWGQKTHTLECSFPYLAAGDYEVVVYHYPDTKILEASYYLSDDTREVEIITVEE